MLNREESLGLALFGALFWCLAFIACGCADDDTEEAPPAAREVAYGELTAAFPAYVFQGQKPFVPTDPAWNVSPAGPHPWRLVKADGGYQYVGGVIWFGQLQPAGWTCQAVAGTKRALCRLDANPSSIAYVMCPIGGGMTAPFAYSETPTPLRYDFSAKFRVVGGPNALVTDASVVQSGGRSLVRCHISQAGRILQLAHR